jgi:hypothetical protein
LAFPLPPAADTPADAAALSAWYDQFLLVYSEFHAAPTDIVYGALRNALSRTPLDVWGDVHPFGVFALTAHLVAMSPGGEAMRLSGETTIYEKERKRLNRIVASGFRVAGLP